ncbi:hypothetical protein CERZMDRAFT_83915 [Cercospora zeae-maydis SCOH1-5]|uniref:Carbohydrate-binding module family 18 protein n=1 Tax=Cercospora zeae-maydis SCOH1-5 TaxID=717836 RepID=A0A6A6FHT7_9PEZI|nr:hypothetical protein CERZMDRAFT_83915 [Cercospora zeae-maydis SCOH1-5]
MLHFMFLFLTLAALLSNVVALPHYNSTAIHNCTEAAATAPSIAARANLEISDKGLCGEKHGQTCKDSLFGDACGPWGFCGSYYDAAYAGVGCQSAFGVCNPDLDTAQPTANTTTILSEAPATTSSSSSGTQSANLSSTAISKADPTAAATIPTPSIVTVQVPVEVYKTVTVTEAMASATS